MDDEENRKFALQSNDNRPIRHNLCQYKKLFNRQSSSSNRSRSKIDSRVNRNKIDFLSRKEGDENDRSRGRFDRSNNQEEEAGQFPIAPNDEEKYADEDGNFYDPNFCKEYLKSNEDMEGEESDDKDEEDEDDNFDDVSDYHSNFEQPSSEEFLRSLRSIPDEGKIESDTEITCDIRQRKNQIAFLHQKQTQSVSKIPQEIQLKSPNAGWKRVLNEKAMKGFEDDDDNSMAQIDSYNNRKGAKQFPVALNNESKYVDNDGNFYDPNFYKEDLKPKEAKERYQDDESSSMAQINFYNNKKKGAGQYQVTQNIEEKYADEDGNFYDPNFYEEYVKANEDMEGVEDGERDEEDEDDDFDDVSDYQSNFEQPSSEEFLRGPKVILDEGETESDTKIRCDISQRKSPKTFLQQKQIENVLKISQEMQLKSPDSDWNRMLNEKAMEGFEGDDDNSIAQIDHYNNKQKGAEQCPIALNNEGNYVDGDGNFYDANFYNEYMKANEAMEGYEDYGDNYMAQIDCFNNRKGAEIYPIGLNNEDKYVDEDSSYYDPSFYKENVKANEAMEGVEDEEEDEDDDDDFEDVSDYYANFGRPSTEEFLRGPKMILDEEEIESDTETTCDIRPGKNPITFLQQEQTQSVCKNPKQGQFKSPDAGWQRVFDKYSPSTNIYHSPVKQCDANLTPTTAFDSYISGSTWILSMSEQFYYDNSILLIHRYFDNHERLIKALRFNFQIMQPDYFSKMMVDVTGLGSGSFGDVYRVRNVETNEYFAIKHLKKAPSIHFIEHTEVLLNYIKERNSLIRARASPYVVQFNFSIKFPKTNGLFLFFEWCICDLRKYLLEIDYWKKQSITRALWNGTKDAINKILIEVYDTKKTKLFNTTLVYIFEVFCAIDFLAQCNIVHQDLKPENIMISRDLHLKIGDFGLSYNTQFLSRDTQIRLVHRNEVSQTESTNYEPVYGGTRKYQDMELCYRSLKYEIFGEDVPEILYHPDRLNVELITNEKEADPNFLSDLWSSGLIATELIFAGAHIFSDNHLPKELIKVAGITSDIQATVLIMTYRKSIYERFIMNGFVSFGGEDLADMMAFLASIFTPRQVRCQDYVKEKEVRRLKHIVSLKHIDIKKVEKILAFQRMGLESSNSFLYDIPRELVRIIHTEREPMYKNLGNLLENIQSNSKENEFFPLEPGINAAYY